MKKILIASIVFMLLLVGTALAVSSQKCTAQIHTYDATIGTNAHLNGVNVTATKNTNPNWTISEITGYRDAMCFSDGCTNGNDIPLADVTYTITGEKEGWSCDTLTLKQYKDCKTCGWNIWQMPCVPRNNDVPEFGVLATLGVLGIIGLLVYKKRK